MSVIVKGMDMPKSCERCKFCFSITSDHIGKCAALEELVDNVYKQRDSRCPLVEIPPHGDLKDTTAFEVRIREQYCKNCDRRFGIKNGKRKEVYEIGGVPCRACDIGDMLDWLNDADVVIPAEGRET